MNAIIISDDVAYTRKAKETFERAARRNENALQWAVKLWRLDSHNASAADMVLTEAADAHLILLGLRNPRLVPLWLQDWLEKWAVNRRIPGAAVALAGENGNLLSKSPTPELTQFSERFGVSLILSDNDIPLADSTAPYYYPVGAGTHFYGCGIND